MVSKVLAICSAGLCNPRNKRRYAFLTNLMLSESNHREGAWDTPLVIFSDTFKYSILCLILLLLEGSMFHVTFCRIL